MTDQEIISNIYNHHLDEALGYLYKQCSHEVIKDLNYKGAGKEDAEDIFQEALLVLIKKIQDRSFRNDSSLKTFLKGIARNIWFAHKRSEERRKSREQNFSDGTQEAEEPKLWRESHKEFAQLLDVMGEGCKELLLKYYFDKTDLETLAKEFNYKSVQVLRNRKALCLKKLRELMKGKEKLIDTLITDSYYG